MRALLSWIIPRLAWVYIYCVGLTTRIAWTNAEHHEEALKEGSFIYAFWHGRQVFLTWAFRNQPVSILVSQSKDGEYIARVMALFGLQASRGSSSRGGARALVGMKKILDAGGRVAFTPDGPRGPQRSVAPGVLFLAQKAGKTILPVACSYKRKLVFHGWDDYWVPLPFNRAVIRFGRPLRVRPEDDLSEKGRELAAELDRITAEADQAAELKGNA